jgi:site-specific DNA recombinase
LHTLQHYLTQQLDRLTEAYLAGVVLLDEYRRRGDLERRRQTLYEQQQLLEAQTDRPRELAGLSRSIEDFCGRVRHGLEQATFDQKRLLIELLIDRIIVTDGEVRVPSASLRKPQNSPEGSPGGGEVGVNLSTFRRVR